MNKILPAGAVALALIGGGAWYFTQGSATGVADVRIPGAAEAQAPDVDTSTIVEMVKGDPDAPIEVIEYASYTCPHCASAHATLIPKLQENYIDTGKVKFTYREVYFDKVGVWASLIARCGGEEKFFGITDLIYKGQQDWARKGSEAAVVDELRKIGRLAGMEGDQIEACLNDTGKISTLIAWYQQNAAEHGINSTPSFVIDGKKYTNMSYEDFSEILDAKLD
ncbi:DsbA family protein [Mameliella sediminis]|uniref:DsbA family protein n=1 Tax=Mameliella sediminis TaxID=2836866 RepID=UPI001C45A61C|nr:DsbA family protein [Mameliella sediminis]MBY6113153.1 DsbA family protein [Antarctobacter heliothermus]MBY6143499.1 DsbA family protein [Mameliella alba]MBV7394436.1 DsbA family protein [Mameliella sediminis]MBY6162579.1 DsbA family protein [Mameliella alba]MBY6171938.1 DsbA family protein [Mameliella alba]